MPQGWTVVPEASTPDYGYGKRWDEASQSYSGPPKGLGWLGPLIRPDSDPNNPTVQSEYSIDGEIGGKKRQYPSLVPTLTKDEVRAVLTSKDGEKLPASVYQKAQAFAAQRIAAGKDPFAGPGEQQALYPEFKRAQTPQAKSSAAAGWTPVPTIPSGQSQAPPAAQPTTGDNVFQQMRGQTLASAPGEEERTAAGAKMLPTVGGMIGGALGGIPGAMLGGGAGEAGRQLLNRSMGREAPATPLEAAKQIGMQGTIQGAAQGAGQLITAGASRLAPALMQSALKPGLKTTLAAVKSGSAPPVVKTLLDEGINVTPGGIDKLNAIIGASNQTIKDTLSNLPASSSVSPLQVAGRLNQTAAKFANQVNPQADLEAISQVGQNFLDANPGPMSTQAAQSLKTGTYAALKAKSYGELKGAAIEAEKTLARGLKEEIAKEAAKSGIDLGAINAREGAAITARDAIAKRVAMVGNRDPAGLAWLAHSPTTFLMALAERSPVVKSMIARGLYQGAAHASGMPAEAIRWAVGAVTSAQDDGAQSDQPAPTDPNEFVMARGR